MVAGENAPAAATYDGPDAAVPGFTDQRGHGAAHLCQVGLGQPGGQVVRERDAIDVVGAGGVVTRR